MARRTVGGGVKIFFCVWVRLHIDLWCAICYVVKVLLAVSLFVQIGFQVPFSCTLVNGVKYGRKAQLFREGQNGLLTSK